MFGLLWCQVEVLTPVMYCNDCGSIEVLEERKADNSSAEVWAISGALDACESTVEYLVERSTVLHLFLQPCYQ